MKKVYKILGSLLTIIFYCVIFPLFMLWFSFKVQKEYMYVKNLENIQTKLELITRKWWFFLIFILIQFIPPYASKGFEVAETGKFIGEVLSHSLVYNLSSLYLIFKILPLALVIDMFPSLLWWNGISHLPLISISVYGLIISLKKMIIE